MERGRWAGPEGLRVTAVRLVGAHRVWADFAGIAPDAGSALVLTRGGALSGRGYFASVEELAQAVDLSALGPE